MSEQIDWSKVTEYADVIGAQEELKKRKAKLFDPKKLVENNRKPLSVYDPELGVISYRSLNIGDLAEINKATSNEEKNIIALFCMLSKTYPDLKLEDIREFGLEAVIKLLKAIVGTEGFFQVLKTSPPGSNQTSTFKG
jgi:hypothetical protein